MFSRLLGKYEDIPIPHEKRKRTDIVCCIVSSLLALGMFVFALVTYIQLGISWYTIAPSTSLAYFNIPPYVLSAPNGDITAYDYTGFIWTVIISTICCIGLGIFWAALVQLVPVYAPKIAAVFACLSMLTIAVFCFLDHNQ